MGRRPPSLRNISEASFARPFRSTGLCNAYPVTLGLTLSGVLSSSWRVSLLISFGVSAPYQAARSGAAS